MTKISSGDGLAAFGNAIVYFNGQPVDQFQVCKFDDGGYSLSKQKK